MVSCIAGLAASIVVALYVFVVPAVKADCYAHDGVLALNSRYYTGPELVSCGNGTNNCCLDGEKCGSNLLCVGTRGQVARQYCSDISWKNCSTLCAVQTAAGQAVEDCGNNVFCCNVGDTQCCADNTGYFVDPNNGVLKAASQGNSTVSPIWWQVDSSAILAPTSSAKNPSTTLAATTITSSSAIPASVSTSMSIPSSSSYPQTTSGPPPPNSLSAGAGAGIGIGGAVILAGIAVLGWFIIRRRRTRKAALHNVNDHQVQVQSESTRKGGSAPGHLGLDQSGHHADQTRHELEGRMRHEM